MRNKLLILIVLLMSAAIVHAQGLVNNGASIVVKSGAEVVIDGTDGSYTNQASNGQDGRIFLDGQISLTGSWYNNAANTVFADPDQDGLVVMGAMPFKAAHELGGSGITTFENLTIQSGTTATVVADAEIRVIYNLINNGTLEVNGDLYIEGSFTNNGDISGTGTVHYQSEDPQEVAPGNYPNLVLDNPGGLVLEGEVFVSGELVLAEGSLVIGEHNLVLGPEAWVTELKAPGTWVDATGTGLFIKEFDEAGSFTFPIGNFGDTPAYTPVDLEFTSGTFNDGWVGIRLKAEKHPANTRGPNALDRYWVVDQEGITEFEYNATFHYVDTDVEGDDALIDGVKSNDGTPPPTWWRLARCNADENYFEATAQTSFSVFTGVEYYKPPVVSITSPVDGTNVYNTPFTISGTGSDADNDLAEVYYRLNGGDWYPANGTTDWSKSVDLKLWENTLEVRGEDLQELESEVVSHTFNLSIQPNDIPQGWSYISAYLTPNDPDVTKVMGDLVDDESLTIMLGVEGIFAPAPFNINTLGNWDVYQGYKVKMTQDDELIVRGDALTENAAEFSAGRHIIPVLTNVPVDLDEVFSDPENQILYMLDIYSNQVYWPEGGISTLSQLLPGVGYLVNFTTTTAATFPPLDDYYYPAENNRPAAPAAGPWPCTRTGDVHLVSIDRQAVEALENVDYIGAFDDAGNCTGYLQIDGRNSNYLLTVYGDDPYTTAKDGAAGGETISYRAINSADGTEYLLTATYKLSFPNYDGTYQSYGLSGIQSLKQSATGINPDGLAAQLAIYPNPARDQVNIALGNNSGKDVHLSIMNTAGDRVAEYRFDGQSLTVDVAGFDAGVYLVKIENATEVVYRKLIVQ